jgi:hypothetical protein
MFRQTTTGLATLLWVERGQTPTEPMFRASLISSRLSRHHDVKCAVHEAMHRLSGGSSMGMQPWVLSQGMILEPDELQMIALQTADPRKAYALY